jgi:hypothetical protein
MASTANMTKIQKSDLGFEIQDLITDLQNANGEFPTVTERMDSLDSTNDSQDHRIDGLESNSSQRLNTHDQDIALLKTKVNALGEVGTFQEVFTYDGHGNVSKHIVTGEVVFTIDYVYADAANGVLNYSEKKYTDQGGKQVTIKKTYIYNGTTGNIERIDTATTIV